MNAIKIWDVAYKGQESGDCLDNKDNQPSLSPLWPDDPLTVSQV